MFIFKKAVVPFLLPPGVFVLLLMLSGAWFLKKNNFKTGLFNLALGCLMWLMTITPIANGLLRGLESGFSIPEALQGDVIVLLGGGVYDKVPDLSGMGVPSGEAMARVIAAVRLQRQLKVPVIVSGGKVFKHINSEADILKRILVDLGVPYDQIITEDSSRDTLENAKFSKKICEEKGFNRPILLTSAFHLKRAELSFRKAGQQVIPFPAAFKSWKPRQYIWRDYLPGSFKYVRLAIKEYLGLIYTRLTV